MADEIVEMVPMDKCGVFTGKSIEDAKRKAADDFQIPLKDIKFKVIEDVKKGFFGKIKTEAKVWAGYNEPDDLGPDYMDVKRKELVEKTKMDACRNYLDKVLDKMGIEHDISITTVETGIFADIDSKGSGAVIGRRGETLDALQYLSSLVANRIEGDYIRVSLDSCGYREKREETLKGLAERISEKALKTGKSTVLEPMNPYERRIIHSNLQDSETVTTYSVGSEPYRKVVIAPKNAKPYGKGGYKKDGYKKRGPKPHRNHSDKPVAEKTGSYTTTYKADFKPQQHKAEYKNFEDYLAGHSDEFKGEE